MNEKQRAALKALCDRWGGEGKGLPFDESHYAPAFDLPDGWVAGWIGGEPKRTGVIYVGCSPEGVISS